MNAAVTVVVVVHVVVCVISSHYYLLIANVVAVVVVVVVIVVAVTAAVANFAIFKCYYCSFRTFVVDAAAADSVVFAILVELIIQSYLFLPLLSQEELGIIPKALLLEIYSRFKFHFVYHATAILNFFGSSKPLLSS